MAKVKEEGGKMDKVVVFKGRQVKVVFDTDEGRKICSTCHQCSEVFTIHEAVDVETGVKILNVHFGKRATLRQLIIDGLGKGFCPKCGAEENLYHSEEWWEAEVNSNRAAHRKEELIQSSIEGRPPEFYD